MYPIDRKYMTRILCALALLMLLIGCGGNPPAPAGFLNHTQHSDAALSAIWSDAQASVARQVDLNALQRSLHNAPPDLRPGDPRAFSIIPHQLTVASHADVSSTALLAATGTVRSDPTGMIACPQPCNIQYATAYSWYKPAQVRYAASWENDSTNFHDILQYEFENQIMYQLGYDMTWR